MMETYLAKFHSALLQYASDILSSARPMGKAVSPPLPPPPLMIDHCHIHYTINHHYHHYHHHPQVGQIGSFYDL